MGLTSEQVHWIFGAALMLIGALLLCRACGRLNSRWLDFVIPAGLIAFGVEMALDPFVHGSAAPGGYAAESGQHLVLGAILILCAGVETVRVWKDRKSLMWRAPLIAGILTAAAVFAFHAQHSSAAPMLLLITQHRVISATLAAAALSLFLSPRGDPAARRPIAFPLLVLLLGAEFMLYTEGRTIFGNADNVPASHSMAPMR